MDGHKQSLKGSEKRDLFKWKHKQGAAWHFACDVDFCLVSKTPPGIVAYLDYKGSGEGVTFAECLAYNEMTQYAPLFIVEGPNPEMGPFTVRRYMSGDWRPEPPTIAYGPPEQCANWEELNNWETRLRQAYARVKREGAR